jgi:hypothetical protein
MTPFKFDEKRIVFTGSIFVIYDIADLLPVHKMKRYKTMKPRPIKLIVYHQSAGGYGEPWAQVQREAAFFVRPATYNAAGKWNGDGRDWPGFAYTWFTSYCPYLWQGLWVVFQTQKLEVVSFHTGDRCNEPGGGMVFQGYFIGPYSGRQRPVAGTTGKPSVAQMAIAEAFWKDYGVGHLKLGPKALDGHYRHGKPACPGPDLQAYVESVRNG